MERYLDAKYYHYDPEDIQEFSDYNVNAEHLEESDNVVTLNSIEIDEYLANASRNDNFQELKKTVPEWTLRSSTRNGSNIINPDT